MRVCFTLTADLKKVVDRFGAPIHGDEWPTTNETRSR